MSAERFRARCEAAARGEVLLIMDGRWINQMYNMDVDLEPDDEQYVIGILECRMCGHRRMCAWPPDVLDEDCQECENCEHMTCEPVTDERIEIVVTP